MPDARLDERPTVLDRRTDLCRTAPFTLVRAEGTDEPGDGLTIDGYGAIFNSPTRIDSWEGEFDEVIAPGAFRKSLREGTPIMQFDHGRHPLIGSIPLGRWDDIAEDEQGLHTVGRITDNWLMQPVRDAIRDGGITGMSFRFSVVREEWTDVNGKKVNDSELNELLWYGAGDRGPLLRTLKELKMPEVGPVVWPAYLATSVGVRDAVRVDLDALNDSRNPNQRDEIRRLIWQADALAAREQSRSGTEQGYRWSLAEAGVDLQEAWRQARRTSHESAAPSGAGAPPEPRSTAGTADEHADTAPPVTEAPAGEHSSDPWERHTRMRAGISAVISHMQRIER